MSCRNLDGSISAQNGADDWPPAVPHVHEAVHSPDNRWQPECSWARANSSNELQTHDRHDLKPNYQAHSTNPWPCRSCKLTAAAVSYCIYRSVPCCSHMLCRRSHIRYRIYSTKPASLMACCCRPKKLTLRKKQQTETECRMSPLDADALQPTTCQAGAADSGKGRVHQTKAALQEG